MAIRPLGTWSDTSDGHYLCIRLAEVAPADATPVWGLAPMLVPVRASGHHHRHRLTARCFRKSVTGGAHDSTPAAVDGCAATHPLRSALSADLAGPAVARLEARSRAVSRLSRIAEVRPLVDTSASLLARFYHYESDVACAEVL